MKWSTSALMLAAGVLLSGSSCSSNPPGMAANGAAPTPVIITPDAALAGKVVSCNTTGRFVVLNFPASRMPATGQTLFLYRAGLKTGEVKISGPQRDNNVVADLVAGDAQAGDEARDQ